MINGIAATADQPARAGLRESLHTAAARFHTIQSQAALNAL
jgi:hypothetical protein